jgi:hypothetical protein
MAVASSAVALVRSFEAIFGSSLRDWNSAKCPSGVKMIVPLGLAPNGSELVPLASSAVTAVSDHAPTISSLIGFCCAFAGPVTDPRAFQCFVESEGIPLGCGL